MAHLLEKIRENVEKVIVGKEEVTGHILTAMAAGGHVLLEDMPGTGKTCLAKTLALSMSFGYSRIQFTPDLLPGDVTGLNYFNQEQGKFVFRKGPVFTNLLLADEINRATPRTQSALLECMGERQVTVDGVTYPMASPFLVIATQNPLETLGCFPLPEAQMDRFLKKITMGPMSLEEERRMIDRFIDRDPLSETEPVASAEEICRLQEECRKIYVHDDLRNYIAALIQKTRQPSASGQMGGGVSPRGTLALLRASQGRAMLEGRDFVAPEDIKTEAVPVLAHRLISEDAGYPQKADHIRMVLTQVPVPTEDWRRP